MCPCFVALGPILCLHAEMGNFTLQFHTKVEVSDSVISRLLAPSPNPCAVHHWVGDFIPVVEILSRDSPVCVGS
jgi:hypothetical protein